MAQGPGGLGLNKVSESLNSKKYTIAIFCDLKKAFDTCDHKILLSKLKKYGIDNTELKWFESYLTDCKQFVSLKNKNSPLLEILLGVPQGSILGPLLFLLYINDLPLSSKFLSLLFADDTTLLITHENIDTVIKLANTEFQKVCEFFRMNRMVLHPDKTKFILFARSNIERDVVLLCNNNNMDQNSADKICRISQVTSVNNTPAVKFLGVYFDPNLNFKYHINILKKNSLKPYTPLDLLKIPLIPTAYSSFDNSIFHCHLLYAIQVWSNTNSSLINELFKMQKTAIRIVSGASYNSHTEPLFKKLQILPLPDLISFTKLQFMQRFTQNFLPHSFANTWVINSFRNIGENVIQLRNANQLQLLHSNLKSLDKFPLYNFPKIWQDFPDEQIKILRKTSVFDQKLKTFFLKDLSSTVNCNRLLCPACLAARTL